MYSNDLNNAYEYECERRKDEMREAAQSQVLREFRRNGKSSSSRLVAGLSMLVLLVAAFLNR